MPTLNKTPAGWLAFLEPFLDAQAAAVQAPQDYYDGKQRLAFATAKFREAFSRFFPPMANNWMKLVVDTPVAKLRMQGFRVDPDPAAASWDQKSDEEASAIWQANNMDSGSDIAHTEAGKLGVCNILVSPAADGGQPQISIEHPAQTYVHMGAADRQHRIAAIKRWLDDDGYAYATVYLPEAVYKFRSIERSRGDFGEGLRTQWTRRVDEPVTPNPSGVVPMIPLLNNPDLLYGGRSDLEVAMPIQDAINKYCLDMQVSSEFHAFPQRYAAGWEKAQDADGKDVDPSVAMGSTRLVTAASETTSFGTFEQGQVENYVTPIEMYVDHLAAVTQTPAYYLKGKMANLSADALRAADAGLNDRCNKKIRSFSDGWAEVMRVAFMFKGYPAADRLVVEVIWADTEKASLAELVDAAVKMRQALSVPLEVCWQLLGWSPQQIRQTKQMMGLPDSPAAAAGSPNVGTPPVTGGTLLVPGKPAPANPPTP